MLVGDEELSGRARSRLGVQGRAIQTSVGPGAGIGDADRQAVRSGDQGQPQSDNLSGDAQVCVQLHAQRRMMRCVRELVYLSERKLRQFQDDAGSGKWFRRITGVTATAPLGLGGLGINLAEQRSAGRPPSLDSVLKQLDRSERAPKWYEDDDIAPGDWVYFEAPMAYAIVERASVALPDAPPEGLLLFLQTSTSDQDAPRVRLLLHGSGEHLIGGGLAPERSFAGSSTTLALHVMARLADGDIGFPPDRSMDPEREHASRIRRLITYMHEHSSIVSAGEASSWMAGCARVTLRAAVGDHATDVDASEEWLLIASPLYVEYSTPPDE